MQTLTLPTPPMLEAAFGYDGQARCIAFYWKCAGDELVYDNGRCSLAGAEWDAWLLFTRHRLVVSALAAYDLGSSEAPARHWLILDRQRRSLSIAPAQEARAFLRKQWLPSSARPLTPEKWKALQEELHRRMQEKVTSSPVVLQAEVVARVAAYQQTMADLTAWLEQAAA